MFRSSALFRHLLAQSPTNYSLPPILTKSPLYPTSIYYRSYLTARHDDSSGIGVVNIPTIRLKLDKLIERYKQLSKKRNEIPPDLTEYAKVSKELTELENVVLPYEELKKAEKELEEVDLMMNDAREDQDLKELAKEERTRISRIVDDMEKTLVQSLVPKDIADSGNAILEIRAGTGGDEAGLFAGEMFRMYERYSNVRNWKFESLNISGDILGVIKEATASISGGGVFGNMKYEAGVHRVQRVPATEGQGRVHTSTVTVAILPQPTEVELVLKESDFRIDYYRSSGKGGQHVNTTDSAVRLTHVSTGIVVSIQDERSQHKNKAKAFKIMRAKLYEVSRARIESERRDSRRMQVGSGDRSEKIRTYNFPQNRVTDHRINLTLYELENIMNGESLQTIVDRLKFHYETEAMMRWAE
ncbi:3478_t:CDS:10 [Paraglomus brasilianum]|uniref:3478_t:CDS:1 n=1 Tax=Paraglomus brasilianum TaxID=144538 RepID=A0A9N9BI59_9GLOM|nr:3478_t:CDS:10 [Paraglomus brasilianum]